MGSRWSPLRRNSEVAANNRVFMANARSRPIHPHRSAGIDVTLVGMILLLAGFAVASYCSSSTLGFCSDYPYEVQGTLVSIAGVVILALGLLFIVFTETEPPLFGRTEPYAPAAPPRRVNYGPSPRGLTGTGTPSVAKTPRYAAPGAAPTTQARNTARTLPKTKSRMSYCPSCGMVNLRTAAYCQRCGRPIGPARQHRDGL